MCLGIPGKIVRWIRREDLFAEGEVEFQGIRRACNLACVPEAQLGDYVIVHAGVAISIVDEKEAQRVFDELERLGESDEWSQPS